MREIKESRAKWCDLIPNEWKVLRLKYVMNNYDNQRKPVDAGKRSQNGEVLYDYYGASGVIDTIDGYTHEGRKLLIGEDGANLILRNLPLIYIADGKYWVNNHAHILAPRYGWSLDFFAHQMEAIDYSEYITGSAQPKLSQGNLDNVRLVVPTIEEQVRIADYLDSKCDEINALSADIKSEIETLEAYKRSVITEAVTKGLNPHVEMKDSGIEWIGEVPAHWMMLRGKYVFEQKSDRGNTKSLVLLSPTQNYGVIPQDMYEKLSGFSAVKLNEKTDLSQLKTVHRGAFVISLRSFQGGFEYSNFEGVVSPAYQVFYPTFPVHDGYYKYLFKTQIFIDKMNSYTMSLRDGKNIAFTDFGRTYIPVPPIEEQKEIVDCLNQKCSEIDTIIHQKKEQLDVLEQYKKSLIYEYVTGKKEVPTT